MSEVGIRALKQNASEVVARAASGEQVTITEHGRPVARLSPLTKIKLVELVETGGARPAKRSLVDLPKPVAAKVKPKLSELLEELRQEER